MRVIPLALILTMLAACQLIPPHAGGNGSGSPPSSTASPGTETGRDQWEGSRLPTPLPDHSTAPELRDWIHYQLHVAQLSPRQLEQLKKRFGSDAVQDRPPAAQLQWAVIHLHDPQHRNPAQLASLTGSLSKDSALNEDSRKFAQQLLLWADQLQRYEREASTLRDQLAVTKESKLELEQKIRKLSDIEETLNQRQREP